MDCQLQPTDVSTTDFGMDFGWHPNVYSKLIGNSQFAMNATNIGLPCMPSSLDEKTDFTDGVSPLTTLTPTPSNYEPLGATLDPTTLWPASMDDPNITTQPQPKQPQPKQTHPPFRPYNQLELPTTHSSLSNSPFVLAPLPSMTTGSRPRSSSSTFTITALTPSSSIQASTPATSTTPSLSTSPVPTTAPPESEKTLRARYAANARHAKTQQARKDSALASPTEASTRAAERKQRHREKNKIAAAKCRSRQRKQVQTIQEKGARLGEKNVQLKAMIQELRGELNELRNLALGHQGCGCSVARYNFGQAERVVREYRESRVGGVGQAMGEPQQQREFGRVY